MGLRALPVIGVFLAVVLFAIAAAAYPGGTHEGGELEGYDWTRHYLSTLFAKTALNGEPNPGRPWALPGMFLYCASLGLVFGRLAARASTKGRRGWIQTGGIGSMVYAFLSVATPMHDLLVSVALIFFLVGACATLASLSERGQRGLVRLGRATLLLLVLSACMYYGELLLPALPVAQKLTLGVATAWLLAANPRGNPDPSR